MGSTVEGSKAGQSCYLLTATCSPLSLTVEMREMSPFAFHAEEANLFPLATAKTSSPLSGPLVSWGSNHSHTLAKHRNLLHWKVSNPMHNIQDNAARLISQKK